MEKLYFGDIYTNGINYWMVVEVSEPACDNPSHRPLHVHTLRPVVLDSEGNPKYFVGYYDGQLSDIRPYARPYKSAKWLTHTQEKV